MKTIRVSILSLIAVSAAAAAFAGPGVEYWNARRNAAPAQAPAVAASAGKCETMTVIDGKRKVTVECTGATAETAKCKAHCGAS